MEELSNIKKRLREKIKEQKKRKIFCNYYDDLYFEAIRIMDREYRGVSVPSNNKDLINKVMGGLNHIESKRNKTIYLPPREIERLTYKLLTLREDEEITLEKIENKIICDNIDNVLHRLPENFVDLLFLDPPYNMNKVYKDTRFKKKSREEYKEWYNLWFKKLLETLKPTATIYACCHWTDSSIVEEILLENNLNIRNRITWKRDKGRGSENNYKNLHEDIWYATVNKKEFTYHTYKQIRNVKAPYRKNNENRDWITDEKGNKIRYTYPSNLWLDLTVPFWSMPENTEHPTQKPEKLLEKIILTSTNSNDMVFDPFNGSGTTTAVAKRHGRKYVGIDINEYYNCLALRRLENEG